jgi:hypothetical protein
MGYAQSWRSWPTTFGNILRTQSLRDKDGYRRIFAQTHQIQGNAFVAKWGTL